MSINWQDLRPLNGSQNTAFEELCCQLAGAQPAPPGSLFGCVWHVDAERSVRWVIGKALSRLLQLSTHVQRFVLVEFAPDHHQKRLPQGMGKVIVLPGLDHRPIRDGLLRKPP